jgi:hypothetical protein
MTKSKLSERDRFWNLVRHYNAVARYLPKIDQIKDDPGARSTAVHRDVCDSCRAYPLGLTADLMLAERLTIPGSL